MENCRSKHDAPEVAREKDRHQRQASQRLIQHLHEHSHEEYPKDILFPPAVYTWNKENNSYDDNIEEKIELKESEQQLVEALGALREDTTETHFVGVTGLSKRSAGSKNARPEKLEVGHVVVVRTEDDDPHSSYLPFFVGEVLGVEDAEGNADSKVHICEYSSPTLVRTHRSDQPEEVALIEVHKVRWQANFRGADSGRQERDEFHRDASCKPSTNAYKPLQRTVWLSAVAEYDTQEKLLNQGSQRAKGRSLKTWVLKVLSNNQRIKWQTPATASRKRKKPD